MTESIETKDDAATSPATGERESARCPTWTRWRTRRRRAIAQGIVEALTDAGWTVIPTRTWDALTRALDAVTCPYEESTVYPGQCAHCTGRADHPRHRTPAVVLREAGDG